MGNSTEEQLKGAIAKTNFMNVLPLPPKKPEIKAGWKTTEFWVVILSMVASDSATLAHMLDAKWAAIVMAVGGLSYAISRGLAKQ